MKKEKSIYCTYIDYAIKKENLLHWACSLNNTKVVIIILLEYTQYHRANTGEFKTFQVRYLIIKRIIAKIILIWKS